MAGNNINSTSKACFNNWRMKPVTLKISYKDTTRRVKRTLETIDDLYRLGDLMDAGKGKSLLYSYVDVDRDEIDLLSQEDVDTLVSDLPQLMQGATALKIYVRQPGEQRKWKDKMLRRAWVWNPSTGQREKYASKSIGEQKLKSMSRRPKPQLMDEPKQCQFEAAEKRKYRGFSQRCRFQDKHLPPTDEVCEYGQTVPKGKVWALKFAKMTFEEKKEHFLKQAATKKAKLEKELAEALAAIETEKLKPSVPILIGGKKHADQPKLSAPTEPILEADGTVIKYGKRVVWSEVVRRMSYLKEFFPQQSVERLEKLSIKYVEREPSELIGLFNAFLERVGERPRAQR